MRADGDAGRRSSGAGAEGKKVRWNGKAVIIGGVVGIDEVASVH